MALDCLMVSPMEEHSTGFSNVPTSSFYSPSSVSHRWTILLNATILNFLKLLLKEESAYLKGNKTIARRHIICVYRLEHSKDNTRTTINTYVLPRLFPFIFSIIWLAFAAFFRNKCTAYIQKVCSDGGRLSAIGEKRKETFRH